MPREPRLPKPSLSAATELVRSRGGASSILVLRDDRVVLERRFGVKDDGLFWTFSASKPFVAVLIHLLAERGALHIDAPVARYWPEFAAEGKGAITIRNVLQHRSGFAVARSTLGDALAMTDWSRSIRGIERAKTRWPPGSVPAYQYLTFGFILGEVIQRVTGRGIAETLADEVLSPLGMADTFLGVPGSEQPRCVPIVGASPIGTIAALDLNRRSLRGAVIPSAGVSTTARDLGVFYTMLLHGGRLGDTRVLAEETVHGMFRPSSNGEIDRYAKAPVRWSQGFQLGGARRDQGFISPLGELSNKQAYGHNGSNCCVTWADPTRRLIFVYLTNRLGAGLDAIGHHSRVADAVISACDADDIATDIGAEG